jgi:hypothetical protein
LSLETGSQCQNPTLVDPVSAQAGFEGFGSAQPLAASGQFDRERNCAILAKFHLMVQRLGFSLKKLIIGDIQYEKLAGDKRRD